MTNPTAQQPALLARIAAIQWTFLDVFATALLAAAVGYLGALLEAPAWGVLVVVLAWLAWTTVFTATWRRRP